MLVKKLSSKSRMGKIFIYRELSDGYAYAEITDSGSVPLTNRHEVHRRRKLLNTLFLFTGVVISVAFRVSTTFWTIKGAELVYAREATLSGFVAIFTQKSYQRRRLASYIPTNGDRTKFLYKVVR